MIKADSAGLKKGTRVDIMGDFEAIKNELACVIDAMTTQVVREGAENEREYATMLLKLYGVLDGRAEAVMNELKDLRDEAEDDGVRKAMKMTIDEIERFHAADDEERKQIVAENVEKAEKILEELEDERDPEQVAEMEDALRDRMAGKDREKPE